MKGLILAGGKGTRLRPITYSMSKQLVRVANKAIVEYGIDSLVESGIKEIGIIVLEEDCPIQKHCGNGDKWGVKFTYIVQSEPLGIAHAVSTAKEFLKDSSFVLYLGDNLLNVDLKPIIDEFLESGGDATILLKEVDNPSQFGVAVLKDGKAVKLEEKPKKPKSNLALVGVYLFNNKMLEIIKTLKPSKRGEYEITTAIQKLIDNGDQVLTHVINDAWWKDTGSVEALLDANKVVLEALVDNNFATVLDSTLTGSVDSPKNTKIINSKIIGPVVLGNNVVIANSKVGPHVSIGDNCFIENTDVSNSVVMDGSTLMGLSTSKSIIGRNVTVDTDANEDKSVFVIGDDSYVRL